MDRMRMQVDVACVGFGPATAGFMTTLSKALYDAQGNVRFESPSMPGMPLQVMCYERADNIGFGVSGVVSRARAIRDTFGKIEEAGVPMMHPVTEERVLYLLDPHGASRRPGLMRAADRVIRALGGVLPYEEHAMKLPYIPPFLQKHDGVVFSHGQFTQWVASHLMAEGRVQIWPGSPVSEPLIENGKVCGIQLADQGVDKAGNPDAGYTPGMQVEAALTVVGDGPVGQVGQALDAHFGLPQGNHQREWAVGMKMVVELPEGSALKPGTVIHTFGYPEPEIFGFLYMYSERVCSLGIFVPSWFDSPARTSYRLLQHWMMHPYLWRYLKGGTLRSWGAKSLQESGKQGEPFLAGDGYARIGEGSGTTNVLTGSGVDEAWKSGQLLAEAVIELLEKREPFTKENLDRTYVAKRRASWLEKEGKVAEKARDGFRAGFVRGMIGMGLSGMTGGLLNLSGPSKPPHARVPSLEEYYRGVISAEEIAALKKECTAKGQPLHESLMKRVGWPDIPMDGKLMISHQDALLVGGKVQAPGGYADHVVFLQPELCSRCGSKVCVELCSAQAITRNPEGDVPLFDREKCVHCGACMWNCAEGRDGDPERGNIAFRAGAGGLHSAEN